MSNGTRDELDKPLPVSAIQHAVYRLSETALIHIERAWVENFLTAEERFLHDVAHEVGTQTVRDVLRVTPLPLAYLSLNFGRH